MAGPASRSGQRGSLAWGQGAVWGPKVRLQIPLSFSQSIPLSLCLLSFFFLLYLFCHLISVSWPPLVSLNTGDLSFLLPQHICFSLSLSADQLKHSWSFDDPNKLGTYTN